MLIYDDKAKEYYKGLFKVATPKECEEALGQEVLTMNNLPKELTINHDTNDFYFDELDELICDYLSDKYGFCINDYQYDISINVHDINWDTTE